MVVNTMRNDFYHALLTKRTPVAHAVDSYNSFVNHDLETICKRSGFFKTSDPKTYLAIKDVRVVRPNETTLKSCIFDNKNYFAKVICTWYVVKFFNPSDIDLPKSTKDSCKDVPDLPPCFSEEFINSDRYPLITTKQYESRIVDEIKDVELFEIPIYTRSVLCESTTAENRVAYNNNFVYDENATHPTPYICESDPGGGIIVMGRERLLVNQMQNRLGEVTIQASKEKGFASVAEIRFGCPVRDAYVLIRSKLDHDGQIYVSLPSVKCFGRVGTLFQAMRISEEQLSRILPRPPSSSTVSAKVRSAIDDIYRDFYALNVEEARAYINNVISHSKKTRGKKKSINPMDFITPSSINNDTTVGSSSSSSSSFSTTRKRKWVDDTPAGSMTRKRKWGGINVASTSSSSSSSTTATIPSGLNVPLTVVSKNTISHAFLNLADYIDDEDKRPPQEPSATQLRPAFRKDRCCVVCDFLAFPNPFITTESDGGFPESRIKIPFQIVSLILKMVSKKGDVCKDTNEAKRVETVSFLLGYLVKKCLIRIKSLETIPLIRNKITENTFAFCNKKIFQCLTGTGWEVQRNCAFVRIAVSQPVIKHNVLGAISHKTRIQQTVSNDRVKAPGLRTLKPGSFGFICPSETPEGAKVGLTFNMANTSELTLGGTWTNERETLYDFLYKKLESGRLFHPDKNPNRRLDVRLDGEYAGSCSNPHLLVALLRRLRREKMWDVSAQFCPSFVVRNDDEVSIYTDVGRFCRPLIDAHFFYEQAGRILTPTELGRTIFEHFAKRLPGFRNEYGDRCRDQENPNDITMTDNEATTPANTTTSLVEFWDDCLKEGSIRYKCHIEAEYSNLALLSDLLSSGKKKKKKKKKKKRKGGEGIRKYRAVLGVYWPMET